MNSFQKCLRRNKQMKERKDQNSFQSVEEEEEETERGTWGHQIDFVLSLIGYAVGLGNIWRFPYLCMRNGGGAFLIPYFGFLFLCGIPLFFLEVSIGQFSSLSALSVWKICPLFKGLGWAMLMCSACWCLYYNIIIAWVLYYLLHSFTDDLPWGRCDQSWNTPACFKQSAKDIVGNGSLTNATMNRVELFTEDPRYLIIYNNLTNSSNLIRKTSPGEEFFHWNVLQLSSGIHEFGGIRWQLLLALMVAWILVFACLFKGVRSFGKVVYVTATLPYILLTVLLVKGATLPGAVEGIKFYITPNFSKLLEVKVWAEACLQIFFSLGPAWGGLITMASYNQFNHNSYRDALLVPIINCGTSLFGGFVIFSVLGFMAHESGQPLSEVVTSGPGLAFMVYPEAISKLPIAPFWAVLFFLTLLTIGMDSQFATFETVVSGFIDQFPKRLQHRKTLFIAFMSSLGFLSGLPLITNAGMYIFQILDWYVAVFTIFIIAILECIVIGWLYGMAPMFADIEQMIGFKPNLFWKVCWGGLTPLLMMIILVYNLFTYTPPKYGDYEYPVSARVMGWILGCASSLPIPVFIGLSIYQADGTFKERIKSLIKPDEDWGPVLKKHRSAYECRLSQSDPRSRVQIPLLEVKPSSDGKNENSLGIPA